MASEKQISNRCKVQGKFFFVDSGENDKGKFLKVSEKRLTGLRTNIYVPFSGLSELLSTLQKTQQQVSHSSPSTNSSKKPFPFSQSIFVTSEQLQRDALKQQCETIGGVDKINMISSRGPMKKAVVTFSSAESVALAIQKLNNSTVDGHTIQCREYVDRRPTSSESATPNPTIQVSNSCKVQGKVFFVDYGENGNGKFVKISEKRPTGIRARIYIPISGLSDVVHALEKTFNQITSSNSPPSNVSKFSQSIFVTSEQLQRDALKQQCETIGGVDKINMISSRGPMKKAVVTFSSAESVALAIQKLNNSTVDGHTIQCREYVDRRPPALAAAAASAVAVAPKKEMSPVPNKFFFSNLSYSCTGEEFLEWCSSFGNVSEASLYQRKNGRNLGSGVAQFSSDINLSSFENAELGGRKIAVREYRV